MTALPLLVLSLSVESGVSVAHACVRIVHALNSSSFERRLVVSIKSTNHFAHVFTLRFKEESDTSTTHRTL